MCSLRVLALVTAALVTVGNAAPTNDGAVVPDERIYAPSLLVQPKLKWWQTGIVYQIYPASFKDSNDDGIGDLPGITEKLEYLQELGVAALWLSPIYKSPNKDMGYDISDFKDIHPQYGTLEDFDKMVAKAHSLGLKVILDFVPNHSSSDHKWFKEALKGKNNTYHDYYIWHDGVIDDKGKKNPPNQWGSIFEDMRPGSAWKYVESLDQYYFRTFHEAQPDLNYNNPAVVREMKNVFRFWARRGVDGFRIDAIPYLFEDPLLRENPQGNNKYTENVPKTYDMVRQWREVFDEEGARMGKDLVMMLEAYASDEKTMEYFGTKDQPAGHFPFNFFLISNLHNGSKAVDYVKYINNWITKLPSHGWSNWVLGNHDNHRIGSRMGEERIDAINMMLLLLPGTAVNYYGEEIGMVDNEDLKVVNCKDPQACPPGVDDPEKYYKDHSRDYERTPFQWDNSPYAGFSNVSTWLPVAKNYETLNVQAQREDPNSHLSIYKQLAELRKSHVIQNGKLEVKNINNVLAFLRQDGQESVVVLINLDKDNEQTVDVTKHFEEVGDLKVYVSSHFEYTDLNLRKLKLGGSAAVVLRGDRYKWWQKGIVYQIYPRSFKDSDNSGDGDLKGITSKLEYLKALGVAAVWLSPIYKSGGVDGGYDISDFKDIEATYGNLDDFKSMVDTAHKLGLKVILDFVPNHSSDLHEFYQDVLEKGQGSEYYDFYVWRDSPNNWRSVFDSGNEGSAWSKPTRREGDERDIHNSIKNKYYLHQYHERQPDLNYRNTKLVAYIKEVLTFWMAQGVDGFRVDAVQNLVEDEEFKDNTDEINYTVHQPETIDMIQQWRELIDEQSKQLEKDLVLMLEVWAEPDILRKYFGDADRPGGNFPFNFLLLEVKDVSAGNVKKAIESWHDAVPSFGWSNWVIGNHDKYRVATRLGEDLIDAMNMLVTLLPGTGITYNGEEIGMPNNDQLNITMCQDLQACPSGADEEYYQKESRDFQRTPFQWNNEPFAGFCNACEPWLPVSDNHVEINEKDEDVARNSHLFVYKKLAKLRSEEVIQNPLYPEVKILNNDVLVFSRENDSFAFLVAVNFGNKEQIVNIAEEYEHIGSVKIYVASNKFAGTTAQVDLSALKMPPKSSVVLEGAIRKQTTEPEPVKWWEKGIVYQIYPRSYQDSDDDGIGDLPGVTSRLQYLKDLGVAAVWFSPIYKSPDTDMGYDISDFKDINDYYGNLDDFDEMLVEAHRLGLKVVLDFVPNHSSDQHKWFQDVLDKGVDSVYYEYYIWRDQTNNWISAFKMDVEGSAWSHPTRREGDTRPVHATIKDKYFLRQFHERQPDLNYRNPKLVQEMKDVLSFWIGRGVDGFRVDAIQHLVEDADFQDNTVGRDRQLDQDETVEIVKQWRDLLDKESVRLQKDIVMMLEVYSENVTILMKYFGSDDRPAGDFPFNFYMISNLKMHPTAKQVLETIELWTDARPKWSNWVVGNHDRSRVGSRVGKELIDNFNMLVTMLPGTAITFQGEEIGMLDNTDLTIKDCQDPQACLPGMTEEDYLKLSRDFERTPFQWDDSPHAGFSTRNPWLPVNKNFETVNVKVEEADPRSHLNVYKKLATLRGEGAIQRGNILIYEKDGVLVLERYNATHVYLAAMNFDSAKKTIDLKKNLPTDTDYLPPMLHYASTANFDLSQIDSDYVSTLNLSLAGYSGVVLTSVPLDDGEDFGTDSTEDGGNSGVSLTSVRVMVFVSILMSLISLL